MIEFAHSRNEFFKLSFMLKSLEECNIIINGMNKTLYWYPFFVFEHMQNFLEKDRCASTIRPNPVSYSLYNTTLISPPNIWNIFLICSLKFPFITMNTYIFLRIFFHYMLNIFFRILTSSVETPLKRHPYILSLY